MDKNNIFKNNADGTVTISRSEYEFLKAMEASNAELQSQIKWFMEQTRLAKHQKFAFASEKQENLFMGQMSMVFNEADAFANPDIPEIPENTEEVEVAAHKRKKHTGTVTDILPQDVETEIEEHRLSEEERICERCGEIMQEIGKEVRKTLKIIPAKVIVHEDWYYTYSCNKCKKEDISVPVIKTPKESPVIKGSFASAEAVAYLMQQKYVMGSPIYRIERDFLRSNIMLSRQTMSNWMIKCAEDWLKPVYEEMHSLLLKEQVLHADETTLQVIKEPGKSSQSKSYMWLYRTGKYSDRQIILYEYRPDRKADNAIRFLDGFKGYLHADGYAGYHKLPGEIKVVGCLAHARRKFTDALKALPENDRKGSAAEEALEYFSKIFREEKKLDDKSFEERKAMRAKTEKPVLDALLSWAETKKAAPKSYLGKALYYLKEQWKYLERSMEDGRLELTNNLAERSIKPFVIDRKNFLFANTPNGAQSSAIIFSMIETAKANNLDPYKYLVYIFKTAPNLDRTKENWITQLLPENAPEDCKI